MKLTLALIGLFRGGPSPWPVPMVGQTGLAVLAVSSVLAKAMHRSLLIVFSVRRIVGRDAMGCVTITLASDDGKLGKNISMTMRMENCEI